MARLLSLLVWTATVTALAAVAARHARAETAVVVLDRGRASQDAGARHAETAVRLLSALRARGVETRFVVYGARPSGSVRAAELRGEPEEALGSVSEREGWRFEGATDPRLALDFAVRRVGEVASLDVYLIGAFGGEGVAESRVRAALAKWDALAPAEASILPLGLPPEGRALLAGVRGRVVDGALVLGASELQVAPLPWSPFPSASGGAPQLEALVRVDLDVLQVGGGTPRPIVDAASDVPGDELRSVAAEPGETRFALRRPTTAKRVATLRVVPVEDPNVRWLVEPPPPRTFQWTELRPDVRLTSATGLAPLPFKLRDAQAGRPFTVSYRLVRTRVGTPPVHTVRSEPDALPLGLDVAFGREVVLDDHTLFRDVRVTFDAQRGVPLDARGRILIADPDSDVVFEIPYEVHVPPGLAAGRLVAPSTPLPLPAVDGEAPWAVVVEEKNANVPTRVRLRFRTDPPLAAAALRLRLSADGDVLDQPLAEPFEVQAGVSYEAAPRLAKGATGGTAEITLESVEAAGLKAVATGSGSVRLRRPTLVVAEEAWSYQLEDGTVVGTPPLRLRIDPDGGSGDWLLDLQRIDPRVASRAEDPLAWALQPAGAGEWILQPKGAWRGPRADTFGTRVDDVRVYVDWSAGGAPGELEVPVEVLPRWGAAGWILVFLAGLALALGAWGILQLRPAAVTGTLLYTVEGRAGAVGRLDLAPVGRRPRVVSSDAAGRLQLGGKGTRVLLLRPTRVGGLAVLEREGARTEHLLVDGLTLTSGRHRVRYVSADPEDATVAPVDVASEDLLGPDFDLPTGRIDAIGPS